ncbi:MULTISPECIES: ImmA/IrrE family metallo-endopeptidase [Lactobacillaceae]|uniref:ImmA/IrrE family metallo-endopeptidase n=1 Tax=Lactobacillaceae TaxID=33958 RepID=UPI001E55A7EB|nr:ImmA/IrrE family metallo-endopeptidase [Lactobacillus sp. HBUAS51381]
MTTLRVPVSRKVIQWAIANGEKSEDELRRKYRLDVWEAPKTDHDFPTFKQVQNFSRDTRIPFNYFFKSEVPEEKNTFVKFRTINNVAVQPSRRLIDTIHAMESRQAWMKEYLLGQDGQARFELSQSINEDMRVGAVAQNISKLLNLSDIFTQSLGDDDFFNDLRAKISKLGIMVMQNGIVGTNTHRSLNVDEFRAFVLIDEVIPLIFINGADSKKAKIFSLVHELVHTLLGRSEVLNASLEDDVASERWINQVTVNILMPEEKLRLEIKDSRSAEDNLKHVSRKFHTSLVATAIRLRSIGIYDQKLVDWAQDEQQRYLKQKKKSSGGDFYNTALSRVDRRFANAVINRESSGNMAIATAASMLGVTLKTYDATVDKLLGTA